MINRSEMGEGSVAKGSEATDISMMGDFEREEDIEEGAGEERKGTLKSKERVEEEFILNNHYRLEEISKTQILQGFKILQWPLLFTGEYASVFKLIRPPGSSSYALKIIRLRHQHYEQDKEAAKEEYRILSNLRHPNIVKAVQAKFAFDQSQYEILMHYAGGNLWNQIPL